MMVTSLSADEKYKELDRKQLIAESIFIDSIIDLNHRI
jgi:hypothetical protein